MTPQQRALMAELRAADYPVTWKLSACAADDKLATAERARFMLKPFVGTNDVVGRLLLIQRQ